MKAVVNKKYGSPQVLHLMEVARPLVSGNHVLIKVHASSVNAADLDQLRGTFMIRPTGLFKPGYPILGSDVAGIVDELGPEVTQFKIGDEVYGDLTEHGFGAFAEYVSVPESALAMKPAGLTFTEAAAIPSAGGVAFLNLTAKRTIKPGDKILINGAGGGMGTFAIQFAKSFGAEVTGVDIGVKSEVMKSAGADHVVDYQHEDVTECGKLFDLILDVASFRSPSSYKRILSPTGSYIVVGGSLRSILQTLIFGGDKMGMVMAYPNRDTLLQMRELVEAGSVKPIIDRVYSLIDVPEALSYLGSGQSLGKIVISM